MSSAPTASPKPSFRASWRVSKTVVSRRNAEWTTSKKDIPLHASNAADGLTQKRLEEDLCQIVAYVYLTTLPVRELN